jgi:methyl-accepting chemotaxis protein
MSNHRTVYNKILLPVLFWTGLLLILSSLSAVLYMRKITQEKVRTESIALIRLNAASIADFFSTRGRLVTTFFENPQLIGYFQRYRQPAGPLGSDFPVIHQFFQRILDSDSTIESIFFADESTGEYFDEEGRYAEAGYSAKNRPWWKRTLDRNRLYCGSPDFDIADSTISTSIQMPVRDSDGRLLGVGGIDILITTVSAIVEGTRYHGNGHAFLVDDLGRMVCFPKLPPSVSMVHGLSAVDSLAPAASGFSGLVRKMSRVEEGSAVVRWDGAPHVALFATVRAESPHLNWKLGLLIPEKIITAPVRRLTAVSLASVLAALFLVFLVVSAVVRRTVRPLDALASRLDEMANHEGDLTQELPVETSDVIGRTAQNFNTFIGQIRTLLRRVLANTRDLVDRTAHLQQQSESISEGARLMTRQAQLAAVTSDQMMRSLDEIAMGVTKVVDSAIRSNRSVLDGEGMVGQRRHRMKDTLDLVTTISGEMEKLYTVSQDLTQTVDAIKEITGQVTILSMNASIEAVRAGEHGQTFSVIAEEIQNLSNRAQESNLKTFSVIQDFRKRLDGFRVQLQSVQDRIRDEFSASEEMHRTFESVSETVGRTASAAEDMKNQTERQSKALREINQNIQSISEACDQIARGILESFTEITEVTHRVKDLSGSADAFQVE